MEIVMCLENYRKPGKQSERSMLISMKFPAVNILEKWNRSEEYLVIIQMNYKDHRFNPDETQLLCYD